MMTRTGFMLPLSLMLMALAVALVSRIALYMAAERSKTKYFGEYVQAQLLSESAVPLIISILNDEKKDIEKKKGAPQFLPLCSVMNRWQRFQFTAERDGFFGELLLYVAVEQGKLDINRFYDWEKGAYRIDGQYDGKKIVEWISGKLEPYTTGRTFADLFDALAKKRKKPFSDVGELLADPAMRKFKRWPTSPPEKGEDGGEQNRRAPTLYDLFTIAAVEGTSLAVLSDSLSLMASMKPVALIKKDDAEKIGELAQKLENPMSSAAEWNSLLAPLTGKEYTNLPRELVTAATAGIKEPAISIVVESTVGGAWHRCAVLLIPQKSEEKSESRGYTVARFYRIS